MRYCTLLSYKVRLLNVAIIAKSYIMHVLQHHRKIQLHRQLASYACIITVEKELHNMYVPLMINTVGK